MLKSPEWRTGLTPAEKIVYIHLKHKFDGTNNGEIALHYSELDDMYSHATISEAFRGLIQKGWITKTKFGGLYRYQNKYGLTGQFDEVIIFR